MDSITKHFECNSLEGDVFKERGESNQGKKIAKIANLFGHMTQGVLLLAVLGTFDRIFNEKRSRRPAEGMSYGRFSVHLCKRYSRAILLGNPLY